ncbi:MAG: hypothetical protein ACLT98_14800 [Eggerthellaceae bacterium]
MQRLARTVALALGRVRWTLRSLFGLGKEQDMLDIRYVRENQEAVAQAMANRNFPWDAAKFSELDEKRRAAIAEEEALQAQRNKASKEIGALMGKGEKEAAEAAKEEVRQINEKLEKASAEREAIDAEMNDILVGSPNLPCDATPVGKDETENPERRRWGTPRDFAAEGFEPKAHWDLGTDLDILDFDRGNKLSGSRFTVLGGAGARLERAD